MGVEILVPLGFFAMVVAIVALPTYLKSRDQREIQQTIRHAVDKGQQLPPDLLESVTRAFAKKRATAHTDLRAGVLWLAVALGIGTTFSFLGYQFDEDLMGMAAWAAIPGFIGLAFILLSFFNKTKAEG